MTTQRLPFPVPDERAHLFVDSYSDMHDLVEGLVVPDGVPEAAATVLYAVRELLRCLRWRNANARHPDVPAAQRRERARIRSEKGSRWGGRSQAAAA
ncbi:hypothetical protein OG887_42200 (plasmid) [Streptomyces sp. NBC_00053]|uniref:hypothetical protein n=1 Tax=unclassified Streptomyces TaxID=2593676 RepID=UPI00224F8852|nr:MULTISPECIES: hypothetical protein [unclassified Streptomyces]MCX5165579.1 hypothetical protein [Streptomyces sp. NBC_00305]MCX5224288.1 hypothetical protein [Streptomyces sp. NBC_00264]MCX5505844.1 hypothetical protein [Streptomyces sp. NBC_00052]MCX5553692.1 hypothetical protein [Streptomyces sp. NBC_00051]WSC33676.1 hypothetical protein OG902_44795 [Streptomyces sp. NBC_01768]